MDRPTISPPPHYTIQKTHKGRKRRKNNRKKNKEKIQNPIQNEFGGK